MSANNHQDNTSNSSTLQQEFDDVFSASYLPTRASRRASISIKSRISSEPIQELDEDFLTINNLIHEKVIANDTIQANPFFKDTLFFDPADSSNSPQNLFPISETILDDSQIESIIGETNNSNNSCTRRDEKDKQSDELFSNQGGDAWPEGWVSLLKSIQKESASSSLQQAVVPSTAKEKRNESNLLNKAANRDDKRISTISGSNRANLDMATKDSNDKSLEKNPYFKLKSKRELEEERRNREKVNVTTQQNNTILKSDTSKNVQRPSFSKYEELEPKRRDSNAQILVNHSETAYSSSNSGQKKDLPKAVHNEKVDAKPVVIDTKQNDPMYINGVKKSQNKKTGSSQVNIQPVKEQVEVRQVRETSEKVGTKKKEQPAIVKKEVKQEKEEKLMHPEVRKSEEKVIENKRKQNDVLYTEKRLSEALNIDQSVSDDKSFSIDIKEEISIKERRDTQDDEEERTSVSQSVSLNESKSVIQEEFISLNKKKKKTKAKNVETNQLGSKKQVLMDQVKKETGKLIQNQFTALQSMNAQVSPGFIDFGDDSKDEADSSIEEPSVVIEKTKKTKSKKKKKIESKQEIKLDGKEVSNEKVIIKGQISLEPNKSEKLEVNKTTKASTVATKTNGDVKVIAKEEQTIELNTNERTAQVIAVNEQTASKAESKPNTSASQNKTEEAKPNNTVALEEDDEDKKASVDIQEGEDAAKKKKKKKKKNKNKAKEEDTENGINLTLKGDQEQEGQKIEDNKPDIKIPKNTENEGSTEDDDPGNNGLKSDYQISKSKKKKLKKKAKQQTLCECLKNAEIKLAEFRNEYFLESSVFSDDPMILDRFKKLLNIQKEMASEVRGSFVRECFEDRGPLGESRIKFQVTLKQNSEDNSDEIYITEKKPKKKKNKTILQEVVEATSADFDSLQKILSEDIDHLRINPSEILETNEELDNVMDTIGYLEMLIKNKTEREADNKPEVDFEDLENMPLHVLLEIIEKDKLKLHDISGGFGGFLAPN